VQKNATSSQLKLTILFEETGKFNIKMISGQQSQCVGPNSEAGQTGMENAPKILLSWDWASIQKDSCDRKNNDPQNYIYCDPVQFSIELLKKLLTSETALPSVKAQTQSQAVLGLESQRLTNPLIFVIIKYASLGLLSSSIIKLWRLIIQKIYWIRKE